MGQNQSTRPPIATPKGPPPRPTTQPSNKPLSQLGPQGPSYVNPENKVLPIVLPPAAKSLLRPVSQELSEYHPEYKEIFRSNSLDDNVLNAGNESENSEVPEVNGNMSPRTPNGYVPDNRRPVSMYQNGSVNSGKGHRRQLSASSSLYSKENTIIEHPDERKFYEEKSKKVTLPAKSTFDMPYSENLTYAQLAEYRRNQTLAELERKTGKKIEDLSSFTEKSSTSLERTPSTRSAKSAKSTGSAVSKKKSRAPPPPDQPPNPPASKSAPSTPRGTNMHTPPARPNYPPPILKSYSLDTEPPADYEGAEPKKNVSINRSASSVSGSRKSYVPQTSVPSPPVAPPPPPTGILRNSNNRNYKSMSELPRSSSASEFIKTRSPPVHKPTPQTEQNKLLSELQKAAETRAFRRQNSEPIILPPPPIFATDNNSDELSVYDNKSQSAPQPVNEKQAPPPVAMKPNRASFERQNSITSDSGTSVQSSVSNGVQSSGSNGDGAIRRLSSLLQHDIKLAAQAKATKIVKHATPVKEKPKDPAQIFREQLAKAAYERDSRAKTGPSIDDQLKAAQDEEKQKEEANILFYTDQVTVKRTDSLQKQNENFKVSKDKKEAKVSKADEQSQSVTNPTPQKETFTIQKEDMPFKTGYSKTEQKGEVVKHPRQMVPDSPVKNNYQNSIYASKDWTPELDLDSDDNISDSDIMTSSLGKSNGFKSTVLPSKVNQMNYKGKKQKGKERKFKKNTDSDDRKKQGSIKKFKKSVHKSVMNAFGSISKASGKVLKKGKSDETDHVDDAPKNWTLSSSSSTPTFSGTPVTSRPNLSDGQLSNRAYKYMVPNGYKDHESGSESSDDEHIVHNNVMFETNGHIESNDESDNDNEKDGKFLKRAGVAYVSKNGQIVVLPEYDKVQPGETAPGEYDNRAPKLKSKKKKFNFDATVRRKEREQLSEQISMDTAEKERKREEERRKEIEAEMEIKRTRESEARERLQRLEMQAQFHQQMLQQQQQFGLMSAPPLPPPNGFQQGYNPLDFSQLLAQQQGFGLQYGTQTGFGAPVFSNSVPNMSYDLAEYMRMMGVQSSTPTNSQHYAYSLLNGGVNWPASLMSYQNKLQQHQDDSKNNQVYQTWTGPKKQIVTSNDRKTSTYSTDESDSSAGLSPQRTNASLSASNKNNEDSYGYKSRISVTTVYTPGFNKSATSDDPSLNDNNANS